MSFALGAYALLWNMFFPLIAPCLARGHEAGYEERHGIYDPEKLSRIGAAPLWIHAVSVGEVQAASPFVRAASGDGWEKIVVSTVTETGARTAGLLMGDRLSAHVYAPWDAPRICHKACDAIAPAAYVTVETEVWPNLLGELRRRGVPRILLNARVSDRAWARARWTGGLLREAYGLYDLILARGEEDARRLALLGLGETVVVAGDCKIDAIIERRKTAEKKLPMWRERLALSEGCACFVAGSTHEGEEDVVLEAFSRVLAEGGASAEARLLLVPRHPHRGESLLELASRVAPSALLSRSDATPARIVVVDIIGVLYELYGLAAAAFIGGSLVDRGGQNILEPASWGVPIQHGTHMEDFAEPTGELDALGAAGEIKNAGELAASWRRAARGELSAGAALGERYIADRGGAAGRAWSCVTAMLAGK